MKFFLWLGFMMTFGHRCKSIPTDAPQKNYRGVVTIDSLSLLGVVKNFDKDWVSLGSFTQNPNFMLVFNNANRYKEEAKQLLDNDSITYYEKVIVTYSMQGLSLGDYIDFVNYCDSLFGQQKIQQKVIEVLLGHSLPLNHIIAKNYRNEKVLFLLDEMSKKNYSESLKIWIHALKTGVIYKNVFD